MIYKCFQQIKKENLLLLKDLLESWRTKFTNIWPLYQQMCKLGDIANEYNNTYHRTIKIKPVDVKPSIYIEFGIKKMKKILTLRWEIKWEYPNIKTFLKLQNTNQTDFRF